VVPAQLVPGGGDASFGGAAREHPVVMIFGLGLSIAMMGAAASFIAPLQ